MYEAVFGSHMGFHKTNQRMQYNFFWPKMSRDIAKFCKTCETFQLGQVYKISDRAATTIEAKPSLAFEIVNIDIIGRIEQPSRRGYSYLAYRFSGYYKSYKIKIKYECNKMFFCCRKCRIRKSCTSTAPDFYFFSVIWNW